MVVFEIPLFLEKLKPLRMFSFILAQGYILSYLFFYLRIKSLLKLDEFTNVNVMEIFFLAYNLVMNSSNLILSIAIILKEISMEFVQMGHDAMGGTGDYSLGLVHFYMVCRTIAYIFNPLNWFDLIYYIIYG